MSHIQSYNIGCAFPPGIQISQISELNSNLNFGAKQKSELQDFVLEGHRNEGHAMTCIIDLDTAVYLSDLCFDIALHW